MPTLPLCRFIFALSLIGGGVAAHADMSACSSAYRKESPDDQIRLYTICLTHGDMSRGGLAGAFHNRGVAYMRKGEIDKAHADFNKSIEYDPKFGLAYFNRSRILMSRGDLAAAEEDLSATITRPPARVRAEAYAYRGVVRMYRGDCADALPDFDMALKMNRKLAWGYTAKAWLLATCADEEERNGAEAVRLAQSALKLQDHWRAHDALATAYAELGKFDDSVREVRLAEEKLDADSEQWRARLRERLGLYEARQPYREKPPEAAAAGEWLASVY